MILKVETFRTLGMLLRASLTADVSRPQQSRSWGSSLPAPADFPRHCHSSSWRANSRLPEPWKPWTSSRVEVGYNACHSRGRQFLPSSLLRKGPALGFAFATFNSSHWDISKVAECIVTFALFVSWLGELRDYVLMEW